MSERRDPFLEGKAQVIPEAWKLYPHTFAERASNGRWIPYAWLRYLSIRLAPAIINGGGRFIITAPPQHGKSEFISHWICAWFLHLFQRRKVILASYAADYATKWGSKVKDTLSENPLAHIPLAFDTKAKKRFMTKEGGQMITAGIGGPITGEGADLFIIDDPVKNYEEAVSSTIQDRNFDWYKTVARTRLQPKATVILLQTRWHESDLAGKLEEEGGFEVINLPAICEDASNDPLNRVVGQALCPERYDEAALAAAREDLGELFWSPLYQQSPVAQKGNIIHGAWIQYYDKVPEDLDEICLFADLSYKDGEENDFAVFEAWGRKGPKIYLVGQIRRQMGFTDQMESFMKMVETYPRAFHKEIEEKANGAALIEVAKNTIMGLIANNPKTEKAARLAAVASLYKSGNVYYPNPDSHPWVKENIKEITKFPKAKHDDTVDVASMALHHLGRMSTSIKRLEALARWR